MTKRQNFVIISQFCTFNLVFHVLFRSLGCKIQYLVDVGLGIVVKSAASSCVKMVNNNGSCFYLYYSSYKAQFYNSYKAFTD